MKQYIGTKIVEAEPMRRSEFHEHKGWPIPIEEGWDGDGYKVRYQDGYESWSPKDVFEAAYRETTGMPFGLAIEAAKMGKRIARKGWNGKGMWVFLAESEELHTAADLSSLAGKVEVGAFLCMKTAQGGIQPGWLASQADMLADDWKVLPEGADMSWSEAEEMLKAGAAVRRKGWESGLRVTIPVYPAAHWGLVCQIDENEGSVAVGWEPEDEDLAANDWYTVS